MRITDGLSAELRRAIYEELQQEFEGDATEQDKTIETKSREMAQQRNQERQQPPGRKI